VAIVGTSEGYGQFFVVVFEGERAEAFVKSGIGLVNVDR